MEPRTVLFVDDETLLLSTLKLGLEDEPYRSLFAGSGAQALQLLSQYKVHVIVTDMRMPEMNGLELLKVVRQKYPDIVRMVLSGYMQATTLLTAINEGQIYKYITKPWELEKEFKPQIREALAHYDYMIAVKEANSAAVNR